MQRRNWKYLVGFMSGAALVLAGVPVKALMDSMGEAGIDARRLHQAPYNLTGEKVAIGQVEIGRPSSQDLDKAANTNRSVQVRRVFVVDGVAQANDYVDEHAASVASIMISQDKTRIGVAPEAALYSSALGFDDRSGQAEDCAATQMVAMQNGGDVRAINFSFGTSLEQDSRPDPVLDGNSLLTQCVDWSARVHNVVYAISGNQGRGGYPIPTDSFNGMTIADSMQTGGVFNKVGFLSLGSEPRMVIGGDPEAESNVGPRRSVVLLAPGDRLETITSTGSVAVPESGTSFAAPHVTGAVALLQQYGDAMIRQALQDEKLAPHWNLDARRQEVMRAVLMNSADKMQDQGDGRLLGMTRTVLDLENRNWLESDAYTDSKLPLNANMGTGHLNAFRAYQQFSSGQWNADAPIPAIGWDYNTVARGAAAPRYRDYVFEQPLQRNSFIAVTIAWDRLVTLNDENKNDQYDVGETFTDSGLNNLDIYLMKADETDTDDSVWSSVSQVDSVEHIFQQIPEPGRYKIRVVYRDRTNEPTQTYGLAWWAVPAE